MSKPPFPNDCFRNDRDRMRHDEVIALLLSRLARVVEPESTSLEAALGRTLAKEIKAPRNVPLHDNSAVDGYAFAHADYLRSATMTIGPRIAAGDAVGLTLKPDETARIFTGGTMPRNADSVAMQEDCTPTPDGKAVTLPAGLKHGANCRLAGEDLAIGDAVLAPGQMLRPQDIATLASLGIADVPVYRRLRVALVSSGNELVRPATGVTIVEGQVYDSNHAMLDALCRTQFVDITDLGILRDDAKTLRDMLKTAAADHDVILTTGGASGGDEDHMVEALDRLGKRHLWQIAIKPGRPMSFGQIGACVFLGLPGNPVAAFVCFLLYAIPVIRTLSGGIYREPMRLRVPAGFEMPKKKTDRREFLRGWLEPDADGNVVACKFPRDGSGLISGLRQANGLIELPEALDRVRKGDTVGYIPFSEFGL